MSTEIPSMEVMWKSFAESSLSGVDLSPAQYENAKKLFFALYWLIVGHVGSFTDEDEVTEAKLSSFRSAS